jgi:hypothetical protein
MHKGNQRARGGRPCIETMGGEPRLHHRPPFRARNTKQTVKVPKMMYVPTKNINLFLGKRFTPRQLMTEIYPKLAEDGSLADLEPFVKWLMTCGTLASKNDQTSLYLMPDVRSPLGNAEFRTWTQSYLHRLLPGMNRPTTPTHNDPSHGHFSTIMAQLLQSQQQIQRSLCPSVGTIHGSHREQKLATLETPIGQNTRFVRLRRLQQAPLPSPTG